VPEFSLLAIVKAVTKELSKLGIKDYRGLSLINKKRRDADKYNESIRGQLNEFQEQIELKVQILDSNRTELLNLKKTIKRLEDEKAGLQSDLRQCKKKLRKPKRTTKPMVIPTSK